MLVSAAAMSLVNREPRDVNASHQYRRTVVYRPARAISNSFVDVHVHPSGDGANKNFTFSRC